MFVEDKRQGETIRHPSLEGVIVWLEGKPKHGTYDWQLTMRCMCAQYGRDTGTVLEWYNTGASTAVWDQINEIAKGDGTPADWTFGKCLERARAAR